MREPEVQAVFRQAMAFQARGDLAAARPLFERLLEILPGHPELLMRLGALARQEGRLTDALPLLDRALKAAPARSDIALLMGESLAAAGKKQEALQHFTRASAAEGRTGAAALFNSIVILLDSGQADIALQQARTATARFPDDPLLRLMLGHAHTALGDADAALSIYESLLPDVRARKQALVAMAHLLRKRRVFSTLVEPLLQGARELRDPYLGYLAGEFCSVVGMLEEELGIQAEALDWEPGNASLHSAQIKSLTHSDAVTEAEIFAFSRLWDARFGTAADRPPFEHNRAHAPATGRPRLGILSSTFRQHVTMTILRPLVPALTRHFELYAYHDSPLEDTYTDEIRPHFARWTNTAALGEAEAAACIHGDAVDVLLDISGHFNARTRILTYRPAPIQVHYADSSCSLGLSCVDYRFSDAIAEPPEWGDPYSAETVLRLPGGFFLYQPLHDCGPAAPCPGDSKGCISFGSCTNLSKITPTTLRLWKGALDAVPGSRFVLAREQFLTDPGIRDYWRARFRDAGIAEERLVLRGGTREDFLRLALWNEIDIALDAFPYSGVTTTLDALWMGVPMVNHRRTRFINRVSSSLLDKVGLADLVAETETDFAMIAARLADDAARRRELRASLRRRMLQSPLCDASAMADSMAAALSDAVARRRESAGLVDSPQIRASNG